MAMYCELAVLAIFLVAGAVSQTPQSTPCTCSASADVACESRKQYMRGIRGDPTRFQLKFKEAEGTNQYIWRDWPCPAGTIFDTKDLCYWKPAPLTTRAPNSCIVMFKASFDTTAPFGQGNDNQDIWINILDQAVVLGQSVTGATGGSAAKFDGGIMRLPLFAGNDLTSQFQIEFRFKLDNANTFVGQYVMLLTNGGCEQNIQPTLSLRYSPQNRDYTLQVKPALKQSGELTCRDSSQVYNDWNSVKITYQGGRMILTVNDRECGQTRDFAGSIIMTVCPLAIGGDPMGTGTNVKGYIDELKIQRGCTI